MRPQSSGFAANGAGLAQPENPNYMPIDASSAKLLGLVKAVVRNY